MGTMALIGLPVADAWGMHGDVGAGWWVVMMIGMALFWGAVILGSVWLVRDGLERRQRSGHETPLAILAAAAGGAVLGIRRLVRHGRKLCDHCGGSLGRCCHSDQAATPAA